ncbi:hypothetical protein Ddye_020153 [Dipteronia dyeriana]|uniref:SHSP domain-containing protein n=1 Tax=Dipteronia dyeriana TaxID=168575 RepID=A0AAD9WWA4_9ROSI|nr:hypothetical protein Ddye_020153 [Dipteronia dyeriana]
MGMDSPLFSTFQHMMDTSEDTDKSYNAPTRTFVRDAEAMAATPADVIEYPNSYVFVIDMPGLKSEDIKVLVEDDNVLTISGERKRDEEKGGAKYVRMERRVGKFMRKFVLPENANADSISAVCQDGMLTVNVEKLPPPEPKKPKNIEGMLLVDDVDFWIMSEKSIRIGFRLLIQREEDSERVTKTIFTWSLFSLCICYD